MAIQFLEEYASLTRGQLGHGPHRFTGSRQIGSNAPAGVFVVPTDNGLCDLPSTAAAIEAGKGGVLQFLVDRIANANGLEWAANDYVKYVTWGHIVVVTEEAVSDQEDVYVRFAAKGGNTQLGACRNDNDAATAGTLVLTNTITANTEINITIDEETFEVATGASGNATTIAGVIQGVIDASAAFAAVDNADGTISITRTDGAFPGAVSLELPDGLTVAGTAATAAKWPGARFVGDHTSGLALVELR